MKNPNDPKFHETIPRPTMWRVSQQIGITQPALRKWFTGNGTPRLVNLQVFAKHLGCTIDEALEAIRRTQEVYKHKGQLPYGLMIEKDMLVKEYEEIINGNVTQSEENL